MEDEVKRRKLQKWGALVDEHWEKVNQMFKRSQVMAVALYGSQNYECETENSDVDTKAIVFPSIDDLIFRNQWSKTVVADSCGGLCDVKDVSTMALNFRKANINYLEILATDYYVVNPEFESDWHNLRARANWLAWSCRTNLVNATAGVVRQKVQHLTHETENNKEMIVKYGYDPKQLASILRLEFFMEKFYYQAFDFKDCLKPESAQKNLIFAAKAGQVPLKNALTLANSSLKAVEAKRDDFLERFCTNNDYAVELVRSFLDDFVLRTTKKSLRLSGEF